MSSEERGRYFDRTESKVREWALKRNGDPVTPHDVIELVLAVDEDSNARSGRIESKLDDHVESNDDAFKLMTEHFDTAMREHIEWTSTNPIPRISALEQKVEALCAPHRASDPPGSDYRDVRGGDCTNALPEEFLLSSSAPKSSDNTSTVFSRELTDMTTTWRVGRWLVLLIVGGMLMWGLTYWADSCARAEDVNPTANPSPVATIGG